MVSQNILVLSAIASHPLVSGHRIRIVQMLDTLRGWGHNVHFVYLNGKCQSEDINFKQMKNHWGDRFYFPEFNELANGRKRLKLEKIESPEEWQLDDWHDDEFNPRLDRLVHQINPSIVIVEYASLSKALTSLDSNILKVIDTHDIFTNRNKLLVENGVPARGFCSLTKEEESRALNRADVIVAIQNNDRRYFQTITSKNTVTVGHLIDLKKAEALSTHNSKKRLLYYGGCANSNLVGLRYFANEIWPKLTQLNPNVELIVAGKVSQQFTEKCKNCRKLGVVEDLFALHQTVDVVVNADVYATGLSMKNITTLGFGKPLVTSLVGARGLEDGADRAFVVADSSDNFVTALTEILSDNSVATKLSNQAFDYASTYKEQQLRALSEIVDLA